MGNERKNSILPSVTGRPAPAYAESTTASITARREKAQKDLGIRATEANFLEFAEAAIFTAQNMHGTVTIWFKNKLDYQIPQFTIEVNGKSEPMELLQRYRQFMRMRPLKDEAGPEHSTQNASPRPPEFLFDSNKLTGDDILLAQRSYKPILLRPPTLNGTLQALLRSGVDTYTLIQGMTENVHLGVRIGGQDIPLQKYMRPQERHATIEAITTPHIKFFDLMHQFDLSLPFALEAQREKGDPRDLVDWLFMVTQAYSVYPHFRFPQLESWGELIAASVPRQNPHHPPHTDQEKNLAPVHSAIRSMARWMLGSDAILPGDSIKEVAQAAEILKPRVMRDADPSADTDILPAKALNSLCDDVPNAKLPSPAKLVTPIDSVAHPVTEMLIGKLKERSGDVHQQTLLALKVLTILTKQSPGKLSAQERSSPLQRQQIVDELDVVLKQKSTTPDTQENLKQLAEEQLCRDALEQLRDHIAANTLPVANFFNKLEQRLEKIRGFPGGSSHASPASMTQPPVPVNPGVEVSSVPFLKPGELDVIRKQIETPELSGNLQREAMPLGMEPNTGTANPILTTQELANVEAALVKGIPGSEDVRPSQNILLSQVPDRKPHTRVGLFAPPTAKPATEKPQTVTIAAPQREFSRVVDPSAIKIGEEPSRT